MDHVQSLVSVDEQTCLLGGLLGNELERLSTGLAAKDLVMLRSLALTLQVCPLLAEENMAGPRESSGKHIVRNPSSEIEGDQSLPSVSMRLERWEISVGAEAFSHGTVGFLLRPVSQLYPKVGQE